jgi:hypothetical protein
VAEKRGQIAFYGNDEYREWLKDRARERRTKVQQLLEKAVDAYVSGLGETGKVEQTVETFDASDLTVTAKDADEKRILTAVLMLLNDPDICPVHRPILEALLAPELEKLGATGGNDDNGDPDEEEGVA